MEAPDCPSSGACLNITVNVTDEFFNDYEDLLADVPKPSALVQKVHSILLLVILLTVMLAMGCDINIQQIRENLRRPFGVIIGMVCQFVVMPLIGFIVIKAFSIPGFFATGVLLVSCCPGGTISNIYTFLCDGDIALSVTMTALSTVIALGMMPLNMWMYGSSISSSTLVIPYVNIITSLIYVTSPVAVGMIIRWKLPKVAPYITKAGALLGMVIITGLVTMEIVLFHGLYTLAPWRLHLAVFLLLPFGCVAGYVIAFLLKQRPQIRRTIAIESGIQNVSIAITIAYLSFEPPSQYIVRMYPAMYGVATTSCGLIFCLFYRIYKKFCDKDACLKNNQKPPAYKTVTEEKLLYPEIEEITPPDTPV